MKRITIFAACLILFSCTVTCSEGSDAAKPSPEAVRPPVAVEAAVAAAGTLTEGIDVTGTLAPKFEVDVKSELTGLVSEVYRARSGSG